MLNYRHLHYFWVVVKEGGFARAAERLDMAVQTISAQVRELEKSLGHQLLKPSGRGVAMTEAGQAAYARAEEIFQLGRALHDDVREAAGGKIARFAVGLTDGISKLAAHAILANVLDTLRAMDQTQLDAQADAILAQRYTEIAPATAPFIMAALQVVWTDLASRIDVQDVPYVDAPGVCPVCGSPPVASIVRIGGAYQGYRYTQCGLCGTEAHVVRVKCTNCDSTKGIAYHGIDGGNPALKAESCDECHTYRKIGYQEKDLDFEPLADDLASLTLDLLMGEAGYRRASPNPLLWPEVPGDQ